MAHENAQRGQLGHGGDLFGVGNSVGPHQGVVGDDGVARNDQTVVAIGRVAWSTELDPMTLDVGLEFVEIDPMAIELLDEVTAVEAV